MFDYKNYLNLLLPNQCLGCHKFLNSSVPLCLNCAKTLKPNYSFYCSSCHKRLPGSQLKCLLGHKTSLLAIACLFDWQIPLIQSLVLNFKYHNLVPLKTLFQIYINSFLNFHSKLFLKESFVLIPVPLSENRKRERGFNQAEIIIPPINQLYLNVITNTLVRIKDNPAQALTLSLEERLQNMTDVFSLESSAIIKGKNILLLDDVYTTGATLNEAAKVLQQGGAKNIIGVTLAGQIY
jgi:competence protein ComFC